MSSTCTISTAQRQSLVEQESKDMDLAADMTLLFTQFLENYQRQLWFHA